VANSDTDGNCFYSGGTVTSSGNNLDDGSTCAFNNAGDKVNTDPLLGPLQDNGGPTLTHALLSGSPAINQGKNSFCPATDQRGLTRPSTACDIGAYEVGETADLAISAATSPTLIGINEVMTYTLSIVNHGSSAAVSVVVTDSLPAEVGYMDASMSGGGACVFSSVISCTLPTLASGGSQAVTIIVNTPAYETVIVNHAQVTSDTPDLTLGNNSVTTTTAVAVTRYNFLPLIFRN